MSGHVYMPVDVELPPRRIADIAGQIGDATLLTACDMPVALADVLPNAAVLDARELLVSHNDPAPLPRETWVTGEQTQYIIFTSGSSGRPKGIEVTASNVANFRRWLAGFHVAREGGRVFLDQALSQQFPQPFADRHKNETKIEPPRSILKTKEPPEGGPRRSQIATYVAPEGIFGKAVF